MTVILYHVSVLFVSNNIDRVHFHWRIRVMNWKVLLGHDVRRSERRHVVVHYVVHTVHRCCIAIVVHHHVPFLTVVVELSATRHLLLISGLLHSGLLGSQLLLVVLLSILSEELFLL